MAKKRDYVIVGVGMVAVISGLVFLDQSNSIFGKLIDKFEPVDWSEVRPRDVVKNSLPITLVESNGKTCTVEGKKFNLIIEHEYFVKSNDLAKELQYNEADSTIKLPCNQLKGEESELHVWYVTEESPKHPTKYQYFVTEIGEELRTQLKK